MERSCQSRREIGPIPLAAYRLAMHPFRFGVTARWAPSGQAWTDLARRAEELGYATLVMPDHLGRQLSPVSALAAAATATSRIRIGSLVHANDYRHPLVLAREAATLDHLSNGRLEFGLGAGWNRSDYRQLGMPYDPPGVRIDRMQEALDLIKRLFAGELVTHSGRHYELDRARLAPRPIQPHVPILIGGGGPRLLGIAARQADILGLLTQFDARGRPIASQATEARTVEKVAIVREAAGSREAFERLELNILVAAAGLVGSGATPVGSALAAVKALAPKLVGGSPYLLHGTLSQVRETLLRRRERLGISYYVWSARVMEPMAPLVEALAGR
jgi:probable F420-dependent oxidoreductase